MLCVTTCNVKYSKLVAKDVPACFNWKDEEGSKNVIG